MLSYVKMRINKYLIKETSCITVNFEEKASTGYLVMFHVLNIVVGSRAYHTLDRVAQGTTATRRPPKVTRWHSTNVDDISFDKSYHEEFRNLPL